MSSVCVLLNEVIGQLLTAYSVCRCGCVLDDDHVQRRVLQFEVKGGLGGGRGHAGRKGEEERVNVGLRAEAAFCRSKWRDGVNQIAVGFG